MARTVSTAPLAHRVLLVSRARLALSARSVQPVVSDLRAVLGLPALADLQVSSVRMGRLVPRVRSGLPALPGLLATRVLLATPGPLGLLAPPGRRVTPAPPGLPVTLALPGHPSASLSLTTHTSRAQSSSPWTARPTTPLSAAGSTSRVR